MPLCAQAARFTLDHRLIGHLFDETFGLSFLQAHAQHRTLAVSNTVDPPRRTAPRARRFELPKSPRHGPTRTARSASRQPMRRATLSLDTHPGTNATAISYAYSLTLRHRLPPLAPRGNAPNVGDKRKPLND